MLNSMTGFGKGSAEGYGYRLELEIKTVNHRFLETMFRMPRHLNSWEESIKRELRQSISRGRVEVFLNLKETEEKKRLVKVDKELALAYDKNLRELAESLQVKYTTDVHRLFALPEVVSVLEEETDAEALRPLATEALAEAMRQMLQMRQIEGRSLLAALEKHLAILFSLLQSIKARAPLIAQEYKGRLRERLAALEAESLVEESRLAMEVALFADKASIEEEVVRYASHLDQFRQSLAAKEPIGRKMDFLLQEINREVNTIGSKANDLELASLVVECKSELEKMREQVQNVE